MSIYVEQYEGAEPYIFISYSHADRELVLAIVAAMSKHGYRVWYDAGINAGEQWTETLANKIAGCAIFLPFISRTFVDSQYCMQEVRYAKRERRNIVPIKLGLGRTQYSQELKFLLENRQEFSSDSFPTAEAFAARLDMEPLFQRCRRVAISNPVELTNSGLDVFISYHEASAGELAAQIAAALESNDISCWYAKRDIPPGGDFARYIPPQIDACKVFLLILNDSIVHQSNHIENEVGLAFGRLNNGEKITILPLEIGNFKRESWVRYYLVHTQSIKMPMPNKQHIQNLIEHINKILHQTVQTQSTMSSDEALQRVYLEIARKSRQEQRAREEQAHKRKPW